MSSDDQATTEDRCSELGTPVSIPSVKVPDGVITKGEARKLAGWGSVNSQLTRELRFRLKQANKTMGRQGQTIANLRGELARVREEHSKIDRGELRRLERFEQTAKEQIETQANRITNAHEKIAALRDELAKARGHVVTGQHAVDRAAAELEAHS